MTSRNGLRRLALVSCALSFNLACSAGFTRTVKAAPGVKVSALAVYPFGFRWDEPAYRSFELSHRLIALADKALGDRVYLFGPSEFKVLRQGDENAWASSTFVTVLPSVGVPPERAVVLRPWAERQVVDSKGELLDKKGRKIGLAASQEITFVGHVEIIHPSSQEVLVEVIGRAKVDPFAEPPKDDSDPAPELTALMEKLSAAALETLAGHLSPPGTARELGLTFGFNPKAALSYAEDNRPALELKLAAMDPIESEVLVQSRIRYANPTAPDPMLPKLARLPGGLFVVAGEKGAKLAPGDLITSVDGQHVGSALALQGVLQGHHPGDSVQISWKAQSGQTHTGTIQLTTGPAG